MESIGSHLDFLDSHIYNLNNQTDCLDKQIWRYIHYETRNKDMRQSIELKNLLNCWYSIFTGLDAHTSGALMATLILCTIMVFSRGFLVADGQRV